MSTIDETKLNKLSSTLGNKKLDQQEINLLKSTEKGLLLNVAKDSNKKLLTDIEETNKTQFQKNEKTRQILNSFWADTEGLEKQLINLKVLKNNSPVGGLMRGLLQAAPDFFSKQVLVLKILFAVNASKPLDSDFFSKPAQDLSIRKFDVNLVRDIHSFQANYANAVQTKGRSEADCIVGPKTIQQLCAKIGIKPTIGSDTIEASFSQSNLQSKEKYNWASEATNQIDTIMKDKGLNNIDKVKSMITVCKSTTTKAGDKLDKRYSAVSRMIQSMQIMMPNLNSQERDMIINELSYFSSEIKKYRNQERSNSTVKKSDDLLADLGEGIRQKEENTKKFSVIYRLCKVWYEYYDKEEDHDAVDEQNRKKIQKALDTIASFGNRTAPVSKDEIEKQLNNIFVSTLNDDLITNGTNETQKSFLKTATTYLLNFAESPSLRNDENKIKEYRNKVLQQYREIDKKFDGITGGILDGYNSGEAITNEFENQNKTDQKISGFQIENPSNDADYMKLNKDFSEVNAIFSKLEGDNPDPQVIAKMDGVMRALSTSGNGKALTNAPITIQGGKITVSPVAINVFKEIFGFNLDGASRERLYTTSLQIEKSRKEIEQQSIQDFKSNLKESNTELENKKTFYQAEIKSLKSNNTGDPRITEYQSIITELSGMVANNTNGIEGRKYNCAKDLTDLSKGTRSTDINTEAALFADDMCQMLSVRALEKASTLQIMKWDSNKKAIDKLKEKDQMTHDEQLIDLYANINGVGSYLSDEEYNTALEVIKEITIQIAIMAVSGGIANLAVKGFFATTKLALNSVKAVNLANKVGKFYKIGSKSLWAIDEGFRGLNAGKKLRRIASKATTLTVEGTVFHASSTVLNNAWQGSEDIRKGLSLTGRTVIGYDENGKPITHSNIRGYVQSIAFLAAIKGTSSGFDALSKKLLLNTATKTEIQAAMKETVAVTGKKFPINLNSASMAGEFSSMMVADQIINLLFDDLKFKEITVKDMTHMIAMIVGLRFTHGLVPQKLGKKLDDYIVSDIKRNNEGNIIDIKVNDSWISAEKSGEYGRYGKKAPLETLSQERERLNEKASKETDPKRKEIYENASKVLEAKINNTSYDSIKNNESYRQGVENAQQTRYAGEFFQADALIKSVPEGKLSQSMKDLKNAPVDATPEQVKKLVEAVQKELGFESKDIDGIIGPKTLQAVEGYALNKGATEGVQIELAKQETAEEQVKIAESKAKLEQLQTNNRSSQDQLTQEIAQLKQKIKTLETKQQEAISNKPRETNQGEINKIETIITEGNKVSIEGVKYQYIGTQGGKMKFAVEGKSSGIKEFSSFQELADAKVNFNLKNTQKINGKTKNEMFKELLNQESNTTKNKPGEISAQISTLKAEKTRLEAEIQGIESGNNNYGNNEFFSTNIKRIQGENFWRDGETHTISYAKDGNLRITNNVTNAKFPVSSFKQLADKGGIQFFAPQGANSKSTTLTRAERASQKKRETLKQGEENYMKTRSESLTIKRERLKQIDQDLKTKQEALTDAQSRQTQIKSRAEKNAEVTKELNQAKKELETKQEALTETQKLEEKYKTELEKIVDTETKTPEKNSQDISETYIKGDKLVIEIDGQNVEIELSTKPDPVQQKSYEAQMDKAAQDIANNIFDAMFPKTTSAPEAIGKVEQFGIWLGKTKVGPTIQFFEKAGSRMKSIKSKFPDISSNKAFSTIETKLTEFPSTAKNPTIKVSDYRGKSPQDQAKLRSKHKDRDLPRLELADIYETLGGKIETNGSDVVVRNMSNVDFYKSAIEGLLSKKATYNKYNSRNQQEGKREENYSKNSRIVRSTGEYKDGQRIGQWEEIATRGWRGSKQIETGGYTNGRREGTRVEKDIIPDGLKTEESGQYRDGKKVGERKHTETKPNGEVIEFSINHDIVPKVESNTGVKSKEEVINSLKEKSNNAKKISDANKELVRFSQKDIEKDYIEKSQKGREIFSDFFMDGNTFTKESIKKMLEDMHKTSAYKGSHIESIGKIRTKNVEGGTREWAEDYVNDLLKHYRLGEPVVSNTPRTRYAGTGEFNQIFTRCAENLNTIKTELMKESPNKQVILDNISDYYHDMAYARPMGNVNNSMFVNQVNYLLKLSGNKTISHGLLDHIATRTSKEQFKKLFKENLTNPIPLHPEGVKNERGSKEMIQSTTEKYKRKLNKDIVDPVQQEIPEAFAIKEHDFTKNDTVDLNKQMIELPQLDADTSYTIKLGNAELSLTKNGNKIVLGQMRQDGNMKVPIENATLSLSPGQEITLGRGEKTPEGFNLSDQSISKDHLTIKVHKDGSIDITDHSKGGSSITKDKIASVEVNKPVKEVEKTLTEEKYKTIDEYSSQDKKLLTNIRNNESILGLVDNAKRTHRTSLETLWKIISSGIIGSNANRGVEFWGGLGTGYGDIVLIMKDKVETVGNPALEIIGTVNKENNRVHYFFGGEAISFKEYQKKIDFSKNKGSKAQTNAPYLSIGGKNVDSFSNFQNQVGIENVQAVMLPAHVRNHPNYKEIVTSLQSKGIDVIETATQGDILDYTGSSIIDAYTRDIKSNNTQIQTALNERYPNLSDEMKVKQFLIDTQRLNSSDINKPLSEIRDRYYNESAKNNGLSRGSEYSGQYENYASKENFNIEEKAYFSYLVYLKNNPNSQGRVIKQKDILGKEINHNNLQHTILYTK